MKTVTFTEFRKQASGLMTEVENGETVLVLRHGRPVAQITPPDLDADRSPSWKRRSLRLAVKGGALSSAILDERSDENLL